MLNLVKAVVKEEKEPSELVEGGGAGHNPIRSRVSRKIAPSELTRMAGVEL